MQRFQSSNRADRQRFDAFQSYGFNFIRLHSHWEAPGYFQAADEHGFFVSPGLPSNCGSPACLNVTMRTWMRNIETHRNNPSVMDAGMGNEGCEIVILFLDLPHFRLANPKSITIADAAWMPVSGHRNEFYRVAKSLNPDLHVIDTDGCCWVRGCNATQYSHAQDLIDSYQVCGTNTGNSQAGQCDRNTTDFMTPFYGVKCDAFSICLLSVSLTLDVSLVQYTTPFIYPLMYDDKAGDAPCNRTTNPLCKPPKPLISHEMGNFGSFPNFTAQIQALNASRFLKPTGPIMSLQGMQQEGLAGELDSWVVASSEHAFLSWKITVEYLRLQPYISGIPL